MNSLKHFEDINPPLPLVIQWKFWIVSGKEKLLRKYFVKINETTKKKIFNLLKNLFTFDIR